MTTPEVRALRQDEHRAAAGVASRALADSPTTVAIYGEDRLDALAGLHRELSTFFDVLPAPQIAAVVAGCVVAVAGMAPPGGCIGAFMGARALDLMPPSVPPVGDPARAHVFWAQWAAADLADDHWHLGPVGVEPGLQGRGIGGAVMRAVCQWLDEGHHVAWLETDKPRNVTFYAALGFEVAGRSTILDVPTWYMRRDPRA